jgi:LacI family gluconate utilization system Gnt-I transcriptional repressor
LSVVGFGDLAFAGDTHPSLSTVRIDGTGIGRQAARFIVERAHGRPVGEKVVDVGFQVISRGSS